jgi:H+/Na+-translocating ferredoxin:NAD+ oxidoreductase subunit B
MATLTPEDIDALLPQTQCGLCGYGGCMPYATAMLNENAPINLCPPGGVDTLMVLATQLGQDPAPYLADIANKAKLPTIAKIDESVCIGCTKCIKVCPVDAILGAAKLMHTVIADECTGCELCIPACPVDCIQREETAPPTPEKRNHFRARYQARVARLPSKVTQPEKTQRDKLKAYVEAALLRVKNKKENSQR